MKLTWSAFALSDRDAIFTYVEADNPAAAVLIDERIVAAARRLLDFPASERLGRIAGTRELVINGTPYVAAYAITETTVRSLRVLHGAQEWPEHLPPG
ncbi:MULTISPECIES: type II toxin-antitoxin system RelE/ParE family toxin [unclassified Shinella]|uniref:type II toxin-antitoxin system RelE/ParE family toxin n=1 Tax=unclassified Shinella TaxID=2643062 RepID=UPI0009DF0591|nr:MULTISPECIES: type II toxin-antitoxin system RelE/ParE family toxin [unclassified Shinella]MCA0341426.1 type II toxin-antitoxin system RelE/ParE family toxin [Pseudomonadota bacterium]MCO5148413.1 type II toxin-antitoxin system RelE/ParE family toxin [Shinella sp.]MDC7264488.1 type II toxin-antitoxin system RelE/ParE family toxin [Shinella sp. HY16]MDC7271384.1 type II toxin-antitoxin system RelE/ParE family toxin [Shinella sp. YZ44]MDG4676156.1 type II toxin-antitoxin system RelE/ParE fami